MAIVNKVPTSLYYSASPVVVVEVPVVFGTAEFYSAGIAIQVRPVVEVVEPQRPLNSPFTLI